MFETLEASWPKPWLDLISVDLVDQALKLFNLVTFCQHQSPVFEVSHFGVLLTPSHVHDVLPHKPPNIAALDAASCEGDLAKED